MQRRASRRVYEPSDIMSEALNLTGNSFSNDFRSVYNNIEKNITANQLPHSNMFMEGESCILPNMPQQPTTGSTLSDKAVD